MVRAIKNRFIDLLFLHLTNVAVESHNSEGAEKKFWGANGATAVPYKRDGCGFAAPGSR
jgi:hypothetical protein